jgi:hypothetical protein
MRFLSLALTIAIGGCTFHIEGTTPPPAEGTTPGDPTPSPTPAPTPPPSGGTSNTPQPGAGNDMSMGSTTNPPPPATMPDMTPPKPTVHVGQACASNADCMEPDLTCFVAFGKGANAIPLPGGYCSKVCSSVTPCPTGSECVATLYGAFCMNKCSTDGNASNQCRAGYACCESVGACGLAQFCGS